MLKRLTSEQQPVVLTMLGALLCILYIAGNIHFKSIGHPVEILLTLIGFWCIFRYGKGYQLKTPHLLFLASILIPLVCWFFAYKAEPDWVDSTPQLEKLARLFLFLPLAWFLKDSSRLVFTFWALNALAILLSPWLSGAGWTEIYSIFSGARIDYGLRNAQHTALLFGFVLIGLITFLPRLYQYNKLLILPWSLASALSLITLLGAQTRASWVALALSFCIALLYYCYLLRKQKARLKRRWLIVLAAIVLSVSIPIKTHLWPIIEQRFQSESDVIAQVLRLDFENIPNSSIGIRIKTWNAAAEHIAERPLTGWGGQGQTIAIERSTSLSKWIKERFGHMHNIYLALLLQYGIVGFIFYFVWLGWMLTTILRQVAKQTLANDIGYFTLTSFTFWSVMGMAESYLFFWTGALCMQILFAGLLALSWNQQKQLIKTTG